MRTLKICLAYDGTDFAGWQVQPHQRTVQGVVEEALLQVTGESIRIVASGRTDAGVHALGQVASFATQCTLPAATIARALAAEVPDDVAIASVEDAAEGFHAIRDARSKRYRYVLHDGSMADVFRRRYAWHYRQKLDAQRMHRCAQALRGTHDFSSFETQGAPREDSVRTVYELKVHRGAAEEQDFVYLEIEADGFLYNMVRAIVGTLVEVGRGAEPEAWPAAVLAARERSRAGVTAPPHGLFLVYVNYDRAPPACAAAGG
jgi:tRNA pseudouridine38-40 synthase